jgi:hypothetical protein
MISGMTQEPVEVEVVSLLSYGEGKTMVHANGGKCG